MPSGSGTTNIKRKDTDVASKRTNKKKRVKLDRCSATEALLGIETLGRNKFAVGNSLIAPNDVPQYSSVKTQLSHIGFDLFFRNHAVCPIGRNYILADRRTLRPQLQIPLMPLQPYREFRSLPKKKDSVFKSKIFRTCVCP